jgi:hypothetical protein
MVTNYPQRLTATRAERASTDHAFITRAVVRLGRILCGMKGHENVLHFEGKRVMMRCTACGQDTPGWEIGERGPRKRFDGDPRRHELATKPHLVLRRSA